MKKKLIIIFSLMILLLMINGVSAIDTNTIDNDMMTTSDAVNADDMLTVSDSCIDNYTNDILKSNNENEILKESISVSTYDELSNAIEIVHILKLTLLMI